MNKIMISSALLLCLSPIGGAKDSVRLAQRDDDRLARVLDTRPSRSLADTISRDAGEVRRIPGERAARLREFVRKSAVDRDRQERGIAVRRDKAPQKLERDRDRLATRALREGNDRPSYRSLRSRDGIRWTRDGYESRTLSADARARERVQRFKEVDRRAGKAALRDREISRIRPAKDRLNTAAEKDLTLRDVRQPLELRDRATRKVREAQAVVKNARDFRTA